MTSGHSEAIYGTLSFGGRVSLGCDVDFVLPAGLTSGVLSSTHLSLLFAKDLFGRQVEGRRQRVWVVVSERGGAVWQPVSEAVMGTPGADSARHRPPAVPSPSLCPRLVRVS